MKKSFLQKFSFCAGVCFLLSGCSKSAVNAPYEAPQWAMEIAEPALSEMAEVTSTAKVDIYYDNTESMYGFAAGTDGSNVVLAVNALRDMSNQYSHTTIYTLEGQPLKWQPFEGDLRTSIADYEGFYTVYESFADATGPLQMLYYDDATLDPAAINVVITDLAEQNVDSAELASKINEHILSQDGYSAALIGIQGDFHGKKYVARPEKVGGAMPGTDVDGKVPLYILITGPDAALETYVNNLVTAFRSNNLAENQDYYVARYHAGNSASVLRHEDIITVGAVQEQDGMKKKDWKTGLFNGNLSLEEIDAAHQDTLIQTESYLDMFMYRQSDDVNGVRTGRTVLNYYVPITRSDGIDLPVQYKVYEDGEKAATVQVQSLYDSKEHVRYAELVTEDAEEYSSAEEWMMEEPEVTGAREILGKEGEITGFVGWKDEKRISRDKDITITYELLEQGTPVLDMQLDAGDRDADELYAGKDLGVTADSDVLHIQIEFSQEPEERDSSTILLYIPIYAMAESVENLPQWVVDWDSAGSGEYIYHTFGLENFFRTLFGLNVTGDADYNRALREVKIADILTCATDLPVS